MGKLVFDDEIEALRDKRTQLRRKILFIVVYSTLVLWALWIIYTSLVRQEQVAGLPAATIAQPSVSLIDKASIAGEVNTVAPVDRSLVDSAAARKAFQQQLVAFDAKHAQAFTHPDFLQWFTVNNELAKEGLIKKEEVTSSKEKALTLFAASAYQDAINMLKQTDDTATALVQSWHQAYEDKLQQAQLAYDNENIKPAELYLNQALAIKPTEARGISLQQQLRSYPRVAALLQALNVAKVENNLQKQADTLKKIIAEDNTRTEWVEELSAVSQQLNDLTFKQAIKQGINAIEQRDIRQAKAAYQRAKVIYPQRSEVRTLQVKITQQQTSNNIQTALNKAEKASQADDWQSVLMIAQAAGVTNAKLQAYQKTAQGVLQAQRLAANYLSRPERLQDQNIRAQAKSFVTNNIVTTLKSPTFAAQLQQLSETIDAASREKNVRISSNGKTDIWVLGVGHVGEIKEKTIRLKPGSYTLEGRCAGYRNKQLAITVSSNSTVNSTNSPIHMVCDERI
ncbi:MAG: tetratricopeptide (TPR) repeat protein [Granulosicoccus sp.]|jgi:tetratricopeptide (TPR) repeat protein